MLSLFVAVILDNLELDEDIKKVKQLKAREQSAGISEDLPLRLKVFESFRESPQMIRVHKSFNEFVMPKVRDSFMRAFIESSNDETPTGKVVSPSSLAVTYRKLVPLRLLTLLPKTRQASPLLKRVQVCNFNTLIAYKFYYHFIIYRLVV